jgi:biopolymer transport protein TolQ
MSFFHLIMGASAVVQLVMLLLLVVSMASWTMIFRRRSALIEAREAADDFEDRFWSGGELSALYRDISSHEEHAIGMAGIFQAGFNEFARLRKQTGTDARSVVEGAQRVMRVVLSRETDDLETNLSFLATVGRDRRSRDQPVFSGHRRFHQSLCRPVRNRVGHHEFVSRTG